MQIHRSVELSLITQKNMLFHISEQGLWTRVRAIANNTKTALRGNLKHNNYSINTENGTRSNAVNTDLFISAFLTIHRTKFRIFIFYGGSGGGHDDDDDDDDFYHQTQ